MQFPDLRISDILLVDVIIILLLHRDICAGTFGFAESIWKLQRIVSKQNYKISVGLTTNQNPVIQPAYREGRGRMWVQAQWRVTVTQHRKEIRSMSTKLNRWEYSLYNFVSRRQGPAWGRDKNIQEQH